MLHVHNMLKVVLACMLFNVKHNMDIHIPVSLLNSGFSSICIFTYPGFFLVLLTPFSGKKNCKSNISISISNFLFFYVRDDYTYVIVISNLSKSKLMTFFFLTIMLEFISLATQVINALSCFSYQVFMTPVSWIWTEYSVSI